MKHISQVLSADINNKQLAIEPEKNISSQTAYVINWLFSELKANFPAFKLAWPNNTEFQLAKKIWLKAFTIAGINRIQQVQHGLDKCYLLEKPFVPSPGEFIAWCKPKPEDIGLPTPIDAYRLALEINKQFSGFTPDCTKTYTVIAHAINQIGRREFRMMEDKKAFSVFERYYTLASQQFIDGALKEIPKALPSTLELHPIDIERSKQAKLEAMNALRSIGIKIQIKGENE